MQKADRVLVGWASIARYLEVDERTVRRWEDDERLQLPVFNNETDPNTVCARISDLDAYVVARAKLPPRQRLARKSRPALRPRAA